MQAGNPLENTYGLSAVWIGYLYFNSITIDSNLQCKDGQLFVSIEGQSSVIYFGKLALHPRGGGSGKGQRNMVLIVSVNNTLITILHILFVSVRVSARVWFINSCQMSHLHRTFDSLQRFVSLFKAAGSGCGGRSWSHAPSGPSKLVSTDNLKTRQSW